MSGLVIKASGMVTAVGFNAPASLAAMRAGIRNVEQTDLWDKYSGEYLAAGKVPLPHWWVGLGKLADLVAPAIRECLAVANPIPAPDIPVLLGVAPQDRPYRDEELDTQILLPEIERRLGFALHPASRLIPRDHVSVVVALRAAGELIASNQAPCAVVAAVDSLVRHDLKNHYLARHRLLTPLNSNGFSLGEAGSAVLVAPAANAPGELHIRGMGLTVEKAAIESELPLRAEGLIQAIQEAFREGGASYEDLSYRITDLNGEHYKFKEMVLAMMRFQRKPKAKLFDLWHPIEYIGDVGAAIGPIVLGLALHASQKGYGVGPGILCTFGNDDGERAAVVLDYRSSESSRRPVETMIARVRG